MDRPMVRIYLSAVFGILVHVLYEYFGVAASLVCLIIFVLFLFYQDRDMFIIVMAGFFILGAFDFNLYYNSEINENAFECRIEESKGNYLIGVSGRKKLEINGGTGIETGHRYILSGSFEKKPDYPKGIIGCCNVYRVKKLPDDLLSKTYIIKDKFYNGLIEGGLDKDDAAVVLALVSGDTRNISYELKDEFSTLGISHVISVSGLHLSIIYGMVSMIAGIWPAIIASVVYALFTGAKAATIRALIMMVLLTAGPLLRKKYDGISAAASAALILLIFKPYYILDAGYILSFLAVIGIFLFYDRIRRSLFKLPGRIGDSISLTLSASVLTVPYMVFIFRDVSIGGILSNLILVPFFTCILIAGIISLILLKCGFLFRASVFILKILFASSGVIREFLLGITPVPIKYTYLDGVMILFLYLSYRLIKHGKRELIYIPVVFMMLVFAENYRLFPEVSFIKQKNSDIVQVNYKWRNIMISPEKVKLKYVYEDCGSVDRIYDEFKNGIEIKLDDNYCISLLNRKNLYGRIKYKSSETEFMEAGPEDIIIGNRSKKYGIIILDKNNADISNGHYYTRFEVIGPWIIETYIY